MEIRGGYLVHVIIDYYALTARMPVVNLISVDCIHE